MDGSEVKCSGRTRADEIAAETVTEVMEDTVTMGLLHAGVDIITGVSQFCDFLS